MHQLTLTHPLGQLPLLGRVYNLGPHPAGGHNWTLLRMGYRDGDWRVTHGASVRLVIDMAEGERMHAVLPAGQSGQPRSPHYQDLHRLYRRGALAPVELNRERLLADQPRRLMLHP